MNDNKVIQDTKTIKNIINRLGDPKRRICLLDCYDDSHINIDDELRVMLINYYKNKLS